MSALTCRRNVRRASGLSRKRIYALSPSSATTDPLTSTNRLVPVLFIARMMLRTLSLITAVGPLARGPTAETTASVPSTAGVMDAGSITSAVITRSFGWAGNDSRAGSRTTAVTSWPAASASSVRIVPTAPVAPKIVIFMGCPLLRKSVWSCRLPVSWREGGTRAGRPLDLLCSSYDTESLTYGIHSIVLRARHSPDRRPHVADPWRDIQG